MFFCLFFSILFLCPGFYTLIYAWIALRSLITWHSSTSWEPLSASHASAFTPSCSLSWPGGVFWPDMRGSSTHSASSPPCFRSASPSAVSFCKHLFAAFLKQCWIEINGLEFFCHFSAGLQFYNTFEPHLVPVCCFVCEVGPAHGVHMAEVETNNFFLSLYFCPVTQGSCMLTMWVFYGV